MDLHVRIALQEADREKRRLIGGAVFLGAGISFVVMASLLGQVALLLWLHEAFRWSWLLSALVITVANLVLAGIFLRIGGGMLKGPLLPQTAAGLSRTTRALIGRM
jgi:uncharacterized membrane protein YqjE